jgi:rod shape-determining protein MreC
MRASGARGFLIFLFLSLAVLFLDKRGLLDGPREAGQVFALPARYALVSVRRRAEDFFSLLTFWRSGEARIKNLELRIGELTAAKNEAERLQKENDELRKQLGVKPLLARKLLPARVLGGGRFLEIGVGRSEGVSSGMAVIYLDNFLGRVVQTTPRVSLVRLPTDPESRIPVKVGPARGLVTGQYNFSIMLDRVAQNEEISPEARVETSGEGESALAGLTIGKIEKVVSSETDVFQRATVIPMVNYARLETVFVVLN